MNLKFLYTALFKRIKVKIQITFLRIIIFILVKFKIFTFHFKINKIKLIKQIHKKITKTKFNLFKRM